MHLDDLRPSTGTSLKNMGLEDYLRSAADETQSKCWQVTVGRHHALPVKTPIGAPWSDT
jgi:hypothetical protein